MVLVDSSIWIEAARRDGDLAAKVALRALLDAAEAAWSGVVRLEVLGNARASDRVAMERLFRSVPYLRVTERDWVEATRLNWQLRDHGLTLPAGDVLQAALARRHEARVFARDAHFETMAGLGLVNLYRPGYAGGYQPGEEN